MITNVATSSTGVTLSINGVDDSEYASYLFDQVVEGWTTNALANTLNGTAGGAPIDDGSTITTANNWTVHVRLSNGRVYSLACALVDGETNTAGGAQRLLGTLTTAP